MKLALKAKKKRDEQNAVEAAEKRQRVGFELSPVPDEDDSDDLPLAYDGTLGATCMDKILLNRGLRFCIVIILAAMVTPCLLWYYLYEPLNYFTQDETCKTYEDFRTPCFNEGFEVTERECLRYLCCYDKLTQECYHTHRSQYDMLFKDWDTQNPNSGRNALTQARYQGVGLLPKRSALYTTNLASGVFTVRLKGQVLQLQLRGENEPSPLPDGAVSLSPYDVNFDGPEFAVQVSRENENLTLLSTSMGPTLLGKAGRWDLVLRLAPNATIVGAHADAAASDYTWLYPAPGRPTAMPTLVTLEKDGRATAMRLLAAAPMRLRLKGRGKLANILQVRLMAPQPASLTIEMVCASTAAEALRILQEADPESQSRQVLPPLPDWALGLVICPAQAVTDAGASPDRDGACTRFKEFLDEAKKISLPWDAHCVEQSFMWEQGTLECLDNEDWDYIGDRRLIAALPNAIRENEPSPQPSLIMAAGKDSVPYVGRQLDIDVRFPDWTVGEETKEWAEKRIAEAFGEEGLDRLAGAAFVQNWPLDSGPRMSSSEEDTTEENEHMEVDEWEVEQQLQQLWEGTLHGRSALHNDTRPHYAWHAHVPEEQARLGADALRAVGVGAPLVFTDAAGPGAGTLAAVTGSLTHGADEPGWASYRAAAAAALGLSVSGAALAAGGPICGGGSGFDPTLDSHLEVCERWYQQAAALPLMWVASPPPHHHPAALPTVTRSRAVLAVRLRYALLPYLRTVATAARALGTLPPARLLALEFPQNHAARAASETEPHAQWMLGPALLVAPAAATKLAYVQVFVPALDNGKWRLLYGGNAIETEKAVITHEDEEEKIWGHTVSINLESTRPIILIRPGYIVPQAASAGSATSVSEALRGGIQLTASVTCSPNDSALQDNATCVADGELRLASDDVEPFTLVLIATARFINFTWTGNSSACHMTTADSEIAALKNAPASGEDNIPVVGSKNLQEGVVVNGSVEVFDVTNTNHREISHENDINAGLSQDTKIKAWKTKEDTPDPVEDETNMLNELDVYGLPTEATTKSGGDDVVTVTVETLNGAPLPEVVSRLFNGRLTLSSIHLDMCSDGGIIATW